MKISKGFFFEKKNQKTFFALCFYFLKKARMRFIGSSFLKNEVLAFFGRGL